MAFVAFGINHKTASIDVREKVAFSHAQSAQALLALTELPWVDAAILLSTCNRTECLIDTDKVDPKWILAWLADYKNIEQIALLNCYYFYQDEQAFAHLIRVASGIDSMMIGETQILGQLKSAFTTAKALGVVNSQLNIAFEHTFKFAKKIRHHTGIGENPVSVASATVNLSEHIFDDLAEAKVLLIGAGEMIELVARHLVGKGTKALWVANRTYKRANDLAEEFDGKAILLADIADKLTEIDIVVSSTASELPILGKGQVERALAKRRHRPIFMVDMAVPRDIEPEVDQLNDVYLYTVDDLSSMVAENKETRRQAIDEAEVIIQEAMLDYQKMLKKALVTPTIVAFRQHAESISEEILLQAKQKLAKGEDPEVTMKAALRLLTNKLIDKPSRNLKKAALEDDTAALAYFSELFDLDRTDNEDFDKASK